MTKITILSGEEFTYYTKMGRLEIYKALKDYGTIFIELIDSEILILNVNTVMILKEVK